MLACQPEGYEAVVFFSFFFHIKILAKFQKRIIKLIEFALEKPKFPNFFG
jgi:hypothetical protein